MLWVPIVLFVVVDLLLVPIRVVLVDLIWIFLAISLAVAGLVVFSVVVRHRLWEVVVVSRGRGGSVVRCPFFGSVIFRHKAPLGSSPLALVGTPLPF